MNDRHDGRTRDENAPTNVEASLAAIIDRYGPSLLYEPERLRLLLVQDFPANDRQIVHLLAALTAEVPQRLLAAHGDEGLNVLLRQLADRLGDDPTFDRQAARWAVRTWANALALPTSGPDPHAAIPAPSPRAMADFASVVTPLSARGRTSPPTPPVPPVPAPTDPQPAEDTSMRDATFPNVAEVHDAPAEARPPDAVLTPPETAPTTPPTPEAEAEAAAEPPAATQEATAPPPTEPTSAGQPAAAKPATAFPNWVRVRASPSEADEQAAATPRPAVTPSFGDRAGATEPSTALPAWARPSADDAEWASEEDTVAAQLSTERPRRNVRLIGTALAALALLAIGVFVYAVFRPSRFEFTGDAIRPPAPARTAVAPTTERPVGSTAVPTNDQAPSVAIPAPAIAPMARALPPAGETPARPADAAAPVPAAVPKGPSITRIELPPIVAGQPFTIGVTASIDAADLAAIEWRPVDATGRVDSAATVTPVAALKRNRSGALLLPFSAIGAPSQTTVEVTVVDQSGGRSQPRRVDLRATAAPAEAVAAKSPPPAKQVPVAKAPPAAKAPPVAKVVASVAPAKAGTPAKAAAACTRSTCGSVVSVRPVDAGWSSFEVIVRLDDRTIQTTRQTARWRVGSRVRIVNGRLQQSPA